MTKFITPKKIRAKNLSIDSRIFNRAKGETEKDVARRITTEVKKFDFYDSHELIYLVAENYRLPKSLIPIYTQANYYSNFSIDNKIRAENYPYWILGILTANHEILKTFNKLRTRLNSKIIKGDGHGALEILTKIDSLSLSWWSTELRIHITKELIKSDTKEYIQSLQSKFENVDVSGWVFDLLLISESNSIDPYTNVIARRMKELRSSGIENAILNGAVMSCFSLPIGYDPERELSTKGLYAFRLESIIDQFILLKCTISEIKIKSGHIPNEILNKAIRLAELTSDAEMLSLLESNDKKNELVDFAVSNYTTGNYAPILETINKSILDENGDEFGLIELYARAKKYTLQSPTPTSFFDTLANELGEILQLNAKSIEKIDYLKKICVKFRNESWAKSLNFHLLKILEEVEDEQNIELSRLQTIGLGELNTPKAKCKDFKLELLPLSKSPEVPLQRRLRYDDDQNNTLILEKSIFPIYSDYLKIQSQHYIKNQQIIDAINFSIDEYLKNNMAKIHLPISKLCKLATELELDETSAYISRLSILSIYSREFSGAYDDAKADIFEDLLIRNRTHRPSTLFNSSMIDSREAYFLRYVCIPSQLDNISKFKSNDEVIHERVAILDILIEHTLEESEELKKEKDRVVETLFSEKLRAKIESGKLFVDVQALETHHKHIYSSLFDQAKSVESGIVLEPLTDESRYIISKDIVEISKDENGTPRAVASNKKTDILFRIFTQASLDFALNENYGLDKYLSAEIRHTVFVTQLRSCFEKTNLITTKKKETYQPNTYWRTEYTYVNNALVDRMDELLSCFSEKVDNILSSINNRFRVATGFERNSNIFDFRAYHHRLVHVSELINKSQTFDDFFSLLLKYMWSLAGENAKIAQQLINEELTSQILEAINTLENDIQAAKGNVAMVDLMQEIKNARSIFTKEIELVLNWFRFVGADDLEDYERLGVVIEASTSSFESIYGHKEKTLEFTQTKSELQLNYRESRALFISLFTALENAFKYSPAKSPVTISHRSVDSIDIITIENLLGDEQRKNPHDFINREKSKWTEANSSLSIEEGGSGLYKIFSLLSNSSLGFGFDISTTGQNFNATMRLEHEYFSNRRQPT